MGIVIKQSFYNTLILILGFAIGGINILFLYTHFLHEDYYGLIVFLLSASNIILPLLIFGMNNTIIKYFSSYKTKIEQNSFLTSTLLLPLFVIIPLSLIGIYFYETIANSLSSKNILIKNYTYLIFIAAIFMGYFEVFYSWTKVKLKSVFGNFIKEIFARFCVSILLFSIFFKWINEEQFIYAVIIVYGIRTLIMMIYAFNLHKPKLIFQFPTNLKEILSYSLYIILAGSAGSILLEIDKFMIPQIEQIAQVAYYTVGIYIANVIGIPTRAMQQITSPITAIDLNENKLSKVEKLYKQTSINLLIIGGLLFILININITDLYEIIDKPQYSTGVFVVLFISFAKIIDLAIGTGNAILINSKYYKMFFYLSIAMAISVIYLNKWLINLIGINGAALTTLVVVFIYGSIKIFYIKSKLKIQPFSINSIKILVLISIVFCLFYFWNFNFHPIINIGLKSIMISIIYLLFVKILNISTEYNHFFKKMILKLNK